MFRRKNNQPRSPTKSSGDGNDFEGSTELVHFTPGRNSVNAESDPVMQDDIVSLSNASDNTLSVYEDQLLLMQSQLESQLIENQELSEKNRGLVSTNEDLEARLVTERDKNMSLLAITQKLESEMRGNIERMPHDATTPDGEGSQYVKLPKSEKEDTDSTEKVIAKKGRILQAQEWFIQKVYEISELLEDPSHGEEEEPEEVPLSLKKLRDNLKRFRRNLQPLLDAGNWINGILHWSKPFETFIVFLVVLYSVWSGWLFQLVLLYLIGTLSYNYMHATGLAERFGLAKKKPPPEPESDSISSTVNIVKDLARTIQVYAEIAANNLEKLKNLFLWRYPEATVWLFKVLCAVFIVSSILPSPYFWSFVGIGASFKFFVMNTIYRKYPRVQAKYDTVARLWAALPTDAQVERRQALSELQMQTRIDTIQRKAISGGADLAGSISEWDMAESVLSAADAAFCDRFSFSADNKPLTDWSGGKRCTLLDKDKPIRNLKHGRLYLTVDHLCFESSSKSREQDARFTMPLKDITNIRRAKPLAVLPGNGMSIEVFVKGKEKPHFFAAIINRDQVLQSIIDHALMNKHAWASNSLNF